MISTIDKMKELQAAGWIYHQHLVLWRIADVCYVVTGSCTYGWSEHRIMAPLRFDAAWLTHTYRKNQQ